MSVIEQCLVFSITLHFKFIIRYKSQGCRVDAVAKSPGFPRSVIEDMSQVGISSAASYLCTEHSVRTVGALADGVLGNWFGKSRPSAAGIVFVNGCKQRLAADNVYIEAFPEEIVVFSSECVLCSSVLSNLKGQIANPCTQFLLSLTRPGFPAQCQQCLGNMAVAAGVLVQIFLMVLLCGIEVVQRQKLNLHFVSVLFLLF